MILQIFSRVLLGSILLCASMCGCGNEEDYDDIQVDAADLTTIENPDQIFEVGDVIYINTTIPFVLPTLPSGTVDFRNVEVDPQTVGFSMALYRKTGFDTYGIVPLSSEFMIEDIGQAFPDSEVIRFVCVETVNGYENRAGIILNEAGTYQLRSSFLVPATPIYYNLDPAGNSLLINLQAFLSQSNEQGDYTFVVE
jgi:hypothetical protein